MSIAKVLQGELREPMKIPGMREPGRPMGSQGTKSVGGPEQGRLGRTMEADYRCQVVRVRTPGQRARCIPFAAWTWWDEEEQVPTLEEQAAVAVLGGPASPKKGATDYSVGAMERASHPPDPTKPSANMVGASELGGSDLSQAAQQLANQQGQNGPRKGK